MEHTFLFWVETNLAQHPCPLPHPLAPCLAPDSLVPDLVGSHIPCPSLETLCLASNPTYVPMPLALFLLHGLI